MSQYYSESFVWCHIFKHMHLFRWLTQSVVLMLVYYVRCYAYSNLETVSTYYLHLCMYFTKPVKTIPIVYIA
jgi:hypothetical protein